MWLQYNQLFYEDIAELRKALSDSDTKWLKALLDRTKAHYDLIRPAALISREPSEDGCAGFAFVSDVRAGEKWGHPGHECAG